MTPTTRATRAHHPEEPVSLVLLSGMLEDESLWQDVERQLRLDRPVDVTCHRTDQADTVATISEHLLTHAPPRFALAGHSFGGIVALDMARRAPTRITHLALLSASARPPSPDQLDTWSRWSERSRRGDFDDVARSIVIAGLPPDTPELADRGAEMARRVGQPGLDRQLRAQATRPDSRPGLSTIDARCAVILGSDDPVCPPALQREVADDLRHCTLTELPGVRHISPLEAPDQVATALTSWLDPPAWSTTTPSNSPQPSKTVRRDP